MGLFDFLKGNDINRGVEDCKADSGAVLLDVRTPEEYADGRIPGSVNIPLQSMERVTSVIGDKDTPLYVYCYSGARSRQATGLLRKMGYTAVHNIGGIASYKGEVER